jgi:hypothetical protein
MYKLFDDIATCHDYLQVLRAMQRLQALMTAF